EQLGEKVDLARTEAVDVDGVVTLDVLHQVEIPLERNVWIVSALNQDLDTAERLELIDLRTDLLEGECIAFSVLGSTRERAETAVSYTDVRVVDVAIDDVRDNVSGMLLLAHTIRFGAELEERGI